MLSTTIKRGRKRRIARTIKKVLAVTATAALALGGLVAGTATAQAAPEEIVLTVNPLENLSNPGQSAVLGDSLLVTGTWDATHATPLDGDEYTIGLPGELDLGYAVGHIFVKSGAANGSGTMHDWASCEVTAPKMLTCTLLPAVTEHPEDVKGDFEFEVKAVGTTTSNTVEFDLNGTPGQAELPGDGGITDGIVIPGEWNKSDATWTNANRNEMSWRIEVPGSALEASGQSPVTITDVISGPHSLCTIEPDQFSVTTMRGGEAADAPGSVDFTVTDPKNFSVAMSAPFAADRTYVITYNTCTDSGVIDATGTEYTNTADISIEGLAGDGIGVGTQNWTPPNVWKTGTNYSAAGNNDRVYRWSISAGGATVAGKNALTITDALSGAHELYTDENGDYELRSLSVLEYQGPGNWVNITDDTTRTLSNVTATSFELDVAFTDPTRTFNGDFPFWYAITYDTVSTYSGLPPSGTVMENDAAVDGAAASNKVTISNRPLGKSGNLNERIVEVGGETYLPYTTLDWNIDIAGERLNPYPGEGAQHTGPLTLTDELSGAHQVCTVGNGTLEERLGLRVHAVDQVGNQMTPFDLTATAATGSDGEIIFTIEEPAGGWDREYRYLVEYTTCTTSGGMDVIGTDYGNSISGVSGTQTDEVTQERRGSGTGTGSRASMGSISISKALSPDSADVPDGTTFSVLVEEYAPETYPEGDVYESYTLDVSLNGDQVDGLNPRGTGWTFVLSEPTFPQVDGIVGFTPTFLPSISPGVEVIDQGTKAVVQIQPRSNAQISLANKALTPSIDIEKWNDEGEAPEYDASGALENDGFVGDFDEAPGKPLEAGTELPVNFTISNDGNEALENIVVSDELTGGVGTIQDLTCDFSPLGGPATGTTWEGPFEVATQFACAGTLPALENGDVHQNEATVTGVGIESGTEVDDEDPWNAYVPDPSIDIEKWNDEGSAPEYDPETGALLNDGYDGDFDEAPGKVLVADAALPINFTISNDGDEELVDIVVSDELTGGVGAIEDLVCTFPDDSTGTEWAGPFAVATQFDCEGTMPALGNGVTHQDLASVTGIGIDSRTAVDDDDEWNAYVPNPSIDIEKWNVETEGVGPEYDPETGALLNDGYDGDFDEPRGKPLREGEALPLSFTISNDGDEVLEDIVVSDQLTDGVGVIADLVCTFPDDSTGTEWVGPFAVAEQFECTATLPALSEGERHANLSAVTGIGIDSRTVVDDEDPWNGYVPGPSIGVEKWNDEGEAPEYDATGLLLNDGYKGDHDAAPGKSLTAGTDQQINFTITNDGQEPLVDVTVRDELTGGVGEIRDLVCTFPDDSTGTQWAGPFAVGTQFECTGTLPGLQAGDAHSDRVTVGGTGLYSGITVGDIDDWHGEVPEKEALSLTGGNITALVIIALILTLGGGGLLLMRRRAAAARVE